MQNAKLHLHYIINYGIIFLEVIKVATIHERIKQRRLELGYTLLYVAEQLQIKEAIMQRYESGAIKNIKHETITKLAQILKCDPSYLMGWTDTPIKIEDEFLKLYNSLDSEDRAEIRGEMKQMLKAPKYQTSTETMFNDIAEEISSSLSTPVKNKIQN